MQRRRRWARAPVIHAASHFYREKRVAWVSISMHAFDPVPIVMVLRLAALRAAGAPLQTISRVVWDWKKFQSIHEYPNICDILAFQMTNLPLCRLLK